MRGQDDKIYKMRMPLSALAIYSELQKYPVETEFTFEQICKLFPNEDIKVMPSIFNMIHFEFTLAYRKHILLHNNPNQFGNILHFFSLGHDIMQCLLQNPSICFYQQLSNYIIL